MAEYAFDVILRAALRVPDMPDEATARAELAAMLDAAYSNFGLWSNGEPILGEASIADDVAKPRLFEVDGADVAPGSYFEPIGETQLAALKMAAKRALCVLEGVATIRQPGDAIAELARALALFSEPESAPANPRHAEITLSLRAAEASKARHDGPTVGPTVLAAFNRMATPTSQYRPGSELDRLATGGAVAPDWEKIAWMLKAELQTAVDLINEALTTHIYDIDDTIPDDCNYALAVERGQGLIDRFKDFAAPPRADDVASAVQVIDRNRELREAVQTFLNREDYDDDDTDRLRGDCRAILEAGELPIPSAADLARSRLNDAGPDLISAARVALNACNILADECRKDKNSEFETKWLHKADFARRAIAKATGE